MEISPPSLGRQVCEALGLKRCRNLTIHVPLGTPYVVAELLLDKDQENKIGTIIRKFRLQPKGEADKSIE